VFHPVIEMTAQMLAERRTRALRDVAARSIKAETVEDACTLVVQALAAYELDVPFALIYRLNVDGDSARLVASAGLLKDLPASPQRIEIDSIHAHSWPLSDVVRSGQAQLVEDLKRRFGEFSCGPYPERPRAALLLPLTPPGSERPAAVLVAGISGRLKLNPPYRDFYDLLASAATGALATGHGFEQERKRAEPLTELDRAKTAFFSNVAVKIEMSVGTKIACARFASCARNRARH